MAYPGQPEPVRRAPARGAGLGRGRTLVATPPALTRHRPLIDAELRAILANRPLPIYDMARYALGWQEADGRPRQEGGGKGLRPALCLLAAEAVGGDGEAARRALPAAAAVELIHNFSLVHDDIQDSDEERHHRPTVWVQWGVGQGINAGDALHVLALVALDRARRAGAGAEAVLAAQTLLQRATLEMIEGQYLDLSFEGQARVGLDEYHGMIERKTGAMIGCSMALGALLACEDADLAERLNRAGRRLGLCFQIRDDFLGVWGDSARTGKASGNDIRRRKKSYPVVYALQAAGAERAARLERIYGQAELGDAEVEAVMEALAGVDAAAATQRAAQKQHDAFQRELDRCDLPAAARATFDEVAGFILQREY